MPPPDWRTRTTLTVEEAAAVLGISRAAAYQSAKRGDLPVLDFGRRRVVPVVRLRKLLGEEFTGDSVTAVQRRLHESVDVGAMSHRDLRELASAKATLEDPDFSSRSLATHRRGDARNGLSLEGQGQERSGRDVEEAWLQFPQLPFVDDKDAS